MYICAKTNLRKVCMAQKSYLEQVHNICRHSFFPFENYVQNLRMHSPPGFDLLTHKLRSPSATTPGINFISSEKFRTHFYPSFSDKFSDKTTWNLKFINLCLTAIILIRKSRPKPLYNIDSSWPHRHGTSTQTFWARLLKQNSVPEHEKLDHLSNWFKKCFCHWTTQLMPHFASLGKEFCCKNRFKNLIWGGALGV
jgi:hypothetical protein